MLPARDRAGQRRRVQVHAGQRIGRRGARREPFRPERFELGRAERKGNGERRLVRRPVPGVFPPRDQACDASDTERQDEHDTNDPDQDFEQSAHGNRK